MRTARGLTFALAAALAASSARAGDVSVQLDSGSGFSVRNATGAIERLRVDEATGNISRGGALFVHTTGSQNVFVGSGAGSTSTSGIGQNTAIGHNALRSVTTGAFNAAAGANALFYNGTGHSNAAFGSNAMFYNSSGYGNAAVGQSALFRNTTGDSNAAVGDSAMRSNTSGAGNAAVGANALRSNTTGYWNVAMGGNALRNNVGSQNSAFGRNALYANTSGVRNAAFGIYALRNSTTGAENAALGSHALRSNTTGQQNTALGRLALYNNTSGSRNVAVGLGAGSAQNTGNDNIYLANPGMSGESGQIKIGTVGTHTQATIAGIQGNTVMNGAAVLVNANGTLGTLVSSARFKQDVHDMADASDVLQKLRPVTFHYTEDAVGGENASEPQYGLIAEEVAEVAPELVATGADGKPYTVKYHVLPALLLNEIQKQERVITALSARIAALEAAPGAACEAGAR
jgi:hypothetical protein